MASRSDVDGDKMEGKWTGGGKNGKIRAAGRSNDGRSEARDLQLLGDAIH
jgi:hypothetical protein